MTLRPQTPRPPRAFPSQDRSSAEIFRNHDVRFRLNVTLCLDGWSTTAEATTISRAYKKLTTCWVEGK